MKFLSLLMWVGQFGFSVIFPTCAFLLLGVWLQKTYALGTWIILTLGGFGVLTSISTARSCLRAMLKEMDRTSDRPDPPPAFNEHQ